MNWAREGTAAQSLLEAWKQNNKAPSIGSYYATNYLTYKTISRVATGVIIISGKNY